MLKKSILLTSLFAGLILLWGCPYTSIVPLGKPVELIRPELIGSWIPENELTQENPAYYTIEKFDSVRYAIAHYQCRCKRLLYKELRGSHYLIRRSSFFKHERIRNTTVFFAQNRPCSFWFGAV